MPNVQCSINISEVDGKLYIKANIPDGAEKTIAGSFTKALMDGAGIILNTMLNDNQTVEKFTEN